MTSGLVLLGILHSFCTNIRGKKGKTDFLEISRISDIHKASPCLSNALTRQLYHLSGINLLF